MGNLDTVILFHSTNHAIWSGKILKSESIKYHMIPVPRDISSDCGYCLEIFSVDRTRVEVLISDRGVEYDKFVTLKG